MRDVSAIEIAVSEAVTNAVVHAYVDVPEGEVAVTAEMPEGDGLLVAVSDDGAGLVPRREEHDAIGERVGFWKISKVTKERRLSDPGFAADLDGQAVLERRQGGGQFRLTADEAA